MRLIVLVVALAVVLCSAPPQAQDNRIIVPDGTNVYANLAYVASGHEREVLDLSSQPQCRDPLRRSLSYTVAVGVKATRWRTSKWRGVFQS